MIKSKQKTIALEKLTPSMTLARDVIKPNGDLIFRKSDMLNESVIIRLKNFGVRKVTIEENCTDESQDPEYIEKKMKEIQEGLDYRFRKVNHVPLMVELKGLIGDHLKGKLVS